MNGPVTVCLKIPQSSDALSLCGQCRWHKHVSFRTLQQTAKLEWPGRYRRVLFVCKSLQHVKMPSSSQTTVTSIRPPTRHCASKTVWWTTRETAL